MKGLSNLSQLARQNQFFLVGKFCFVLSKVLGIFFGNEVSFWGSVSCFNSIEIAGNKIGIASEAAKNIMLRAARMVNVPERISGKIFNSPKIARLFHADCKI